jgi:hypothetical protein
MVPFTSSAERELADATGAMAVSPFASASAGADGRRLVAVPGSAREPYVEARGSAREPTLVSSLKGSILVGDTRASVLVAPQRSATTKVTALRFHFTDPQR